MRHLWVRLTEGPLFHYAERKGLALCGLRFDPGDRRESYDRTDERFIEWLERRACPECLRVWEEEWAK